jgi:hypothetical protein
VSGRDAFEEEMGFLGRIRDEDVERLLSGRAPEADREGGLGEVGAFITAIRATVPAPPDRDAEAFLVPRLAAEARSAADARAAADTGTAGVARARRRRPRLALAAKVAVGAVLVPVAMTGLAFAGVGLPEPARSAFEQAGVELPNQSDGDEVTSDDGAGANEGQPSQSRGGEDEGAAADRGSGGTEPAKRGRDRKAESDRPRGSSGGGNGGQASPPSGTGPSGVPPGQGGTPPGQGGTPPGQGGFPPGQGGTPPGQGGAIPGSGSGGQSGEAHGGAPPPGQAKQSSPKRQSSNSA